MAGQRANTVNKRPIIGLARNPKGVAFRCGTCEYFSRGLCKNDDPKLHNQEVDAQTDCCDLYDHTGMIRRIG